MLPYLPFDLPLFLRSVEPSSVSVSSSLTVWCSHGDFSWIKTQFWVYDLDDNFFKDNYYEQIFWIITFKFNYSGAARYAEGSLFRTLIPKFRIPGGSLIQQERQWRSAHPASRNIKYRKFHVVQFSTGQKINIWCPGKGLKIKKLEWEKYKYDAPEGTWKK